MCRVCELCRPIVNRCLDEGYEITTAKLQKLLYLIQGEYLKKYNKVIFNEDILAWNCGMAIREVNAEYSGEEAIFGFQKRLEVRIALLDSELDVIQNVLRNYGKLSATQIMQLPIAKRLWDKHYVEGTSTPIPVDEIREMFINNG